MLIDARSLPPEEELEADLCIIGAGPAGITLAVELLHTGARICLLESGGEERIPLPDGESIGYPYFPLADAGVRGFGGSSLHWGSGDGDFWYAVPLDELDFEQRPGIAHSGWPFTRAELAPFYERAAALTGLETFASLSDLEEDDAAAHLPVRRGRLVSRPIEVTSSRFTQHLQRLKVAGNVQLLLHATAAELLTENDGKSAVGVRAFGSPGQAFTVRSRTTVLASGGFENARLLLLSTSAHRAGLGNEHDLVGRFFMEHPALRSGAVMPSSPAVLGQTYLYTARDNAGTHVLPVLRLHEDVVRQEELLSVAFFLDPSPLSGAPGGVRSFWTLREVRKVMPHAPLRDQLGYVRNALGDFDDVVRTVRRRGAPGNPEVLLLRVQAEQSPNPRSRVMLSDNRDAFGLRKLRLNWELQDIDRRSIRRTQELLSDELQSSGLGHVEDLLGDERPPALIRGIYHHMGTTRMSSDPKQGVTDRDGRVHGVNGLFATGTSIFPTSGWANPTFTLLALAVKLSHLLRHSLGSA